MSVFEEFLKKHCPDGVEWKNLGEVCNTITDYVAAGSFKDIAKNVEYLRNPDYAQLVRTTDIKNNFKNNGFVYVNKKAFDYLYRVNLDKESIILPNVGNCGEVYYITPDLLPYKNNVLGPNAILVRSDSSNNKFLSYIFQLKLFQTQLRKIISTAGQPKFNKTEFKKIYIPVPPIEVQKEIVRILDTFTKYQDLLNRELELRKKQYEYYRNYLFNKIQSYNNVLLGDIADISVGSKPEFISDNKTEFEYINAGTTNSGYTNNYNCLGDTVTTPSRGQGGIGYIGYQKNNFWLGALCYQIRSNKDYILTKYIYYYLKNNNELILKIKNSGGLPSVNRNDLIKINIKFPSLEYQKEIIDILDQFDTLCNDITKGLPAEIDLRKKQYEYYRDKLLTFKEKKK